MIMASYAKTLSYAIAHLLLQMDAYLLWPTFAHNAIAASKKPMGNTNSDIMSIPLWDRGVRLFSLSGPILFSGSFWVICRARIMAYSEVAKKINTMHKEIHLTRAVDPSSGWGDFSLTEFRVLNMQRDKMTSKPKRPGTTSGGTKKLVWNISKACLRIAVFYVLLKINFLPKTTQPGLQWGL